MSASAVLGRRLNEVEWAEFRRFVEEGLRVVFGRRLEAVLDIAENGYAGIVAYIALSEKSRAAVKIVNGEELACSVTVWGAGEGEARRLLYKLQALAQMFSESGGRRGVLYLVYVPGTSIVPMRSESAVGKALQMLVYNNMVFLFALSIAVSSVVISVFGVRLAPLVIVAVQSVLMLALSYLLPLGLGDWRIDHRHQEVVILTIRMPLDVFLEVVPRLLKKHKVEFKARIYQELLEGGWADSLASVKWLLADYGIPPQLTDLELKRVNVYAMASRVAARFGIRVPRIVLSNVIAPNAAAVGVYPFASSLIVTTGLLARLGEDEIEAVLAHEMSHMKHNDVVLFLALSSAEYIARVYILLNVLIYTMVPFLPFIYMLLSITALFFLAKFIEARADLEAALKTGRASSLAFALSSIGFAKLLAEANPTRRFFAWISWNPHPPVSFRVEMLDRISQGKVVRGVWTTAALECIGDFIKSAAAAFWGS